MAIHSENSQIALVLKHLLSGEEITPIEALNKYGCYRLGAVIFNLKKEGYRIKTRMEYFKKPTGTTGNYAVYKLEEETNV